MDLVGVVSRPRLLKAHCFNNLALFLGKDYVNFIVKDIARPDLPEADNVDRRTTPRYLAFRNF